MTKKARPAQNINDTPANRARRAVPVEVAEVMGWFKDELSKIPDHTHATKLAGLLNTIASGPISDAPPDPDHGARIEIARAIRTLQQELPREIRRRRENLTRIMLPPSTFEVVRQNEQACIDRDKDLLEAVNRAATKMYWPEIPRKRMAAWHSLAVVFGFQVARVIREMGCSAKVGTVAAIVDAALDRIGDPRERDSIVKALRKEISSLRSRNYEDPFFP